MRLQNQNLRKRFVFSEVATGVCDLKSKLNSFCMGHAITISWYCVTELQ